MITRRSVGRLALCCGFLCLSQLFGAGINPSAAPCPSSFRLSAFIGSSVGCNLGGEFNVSEFDFTASAGAPLNALDITVTPSVTTVSGNIIMIDLNFSTTGGFTNAGEAPIQYTFDYIIDPRPPVIQGASISLDPGGMLTENICAGGVFSGSLCTPSGAFNSTLVATTLLPNASTAFPASVSTVDYHIVLDLPAGASAGGFDSGSITGLGDATDAPEPSSTLLAGSGLLGLLGFCSRSKLRKVVLQLFPRI